MDYYCSKCKTSITEKVYEYSLENCGKILCIECQKITEEQKENSETNNNKYSFDMIKGRIAEALIEELFTSLEYNVFRYGMESTVPGIKKLLREIRGDVATNIRRMPDFIVQKPGIKEAFFIEVKFRANEKFDINDSSLIDYPYRNAYFIVVSKSHIKCITYEELEAGESITPSDKKYLGSRKEFALDKDTIITFCEFAVKFFENV